MTETDALSCFIVGRYRSRENRFVMRVKLPEGAIVDAFCPNTSRLIGLLEGKPELLLTAANNPDRKTDYTVRGIRNNETWVGIEASRANDFFESFLESGDPDAFGTWGSWEREVTHDSSQFDFHFPERTPQGWVEVKSLSSRSSDGAAFYSGTPSRRGYRHLDHLGNLAEKGKEAWCVFVVQREDVDRLKEADVTQVDWIQALRRADERGVTVAGYRCRFTGEDWIIEDKIPTQL